MTLPATYEVLVALAVTACAANSVRTLRVAGRRYRAIIKAGTNGSVRRWGWMHYRTEGVLLAMQLMLLSVCVFRVWHPEPFGATVRLVMGVALAVKVCLNMRDYAWIEEHTADPPPPGPSMQL